MWRVNLNAISSKSHGWKYGLHETCVSCLKLALDPNPRFLHVLKVIDFHQKLGHIDTRSFKELFVSFLV